MRYKEKDIKNNEIDVYGDVEMPKGRSRTDSRKRNIILLVVGVALFLLVIKFSVLDRLKEITKWLSENFQYLIGLVIGIAMVIYGTKMAMDFRKREKVGAGIALVIGGVILTMVALFKMGISP